MSRPLSIHRGIVKKPTVILISLRLSPPGGGGAGNATIWVVVHLFLCMTSSRAPHLFDRKEEGMAGTLPEAPLTQEHNR